MPDMSELEVWNRVYREAHISGFLLSKSASIQLDITAMK